MSSYSHPPHVHTGSPALAVPASVPAATVPAAAIPRLPYSIHLDGLSDIGPYSEPRRPVGYAPTAIFPFDEELELHERRFANPAPIYRLGRASTANNTPQPADDADECVSLAGSSVSSAAGSSGASTPPLDSRTDSPGIAVEGEGSVSELQFALSISLPSLLLPTKPSPSSRPQQHRRGGWKAWGL